MNGTPRGFDAPSFLNPDTLTFLPEMTVEDSSKTYIPDPAGDAQRKAEAIRRTRNSIYSKSIKSAMSVRSAGSDEEDGPVQRAPSRAKSIRSLRRRASQSQKWEGSTAGEGVLLESNGLDQTHNGGYTTLILPTGAYTPANPIKSTSEINARVLGLPHAAMAALVLSSATHRLRSDTPAHLRSQLPAPVDFSSHLKPPSKVGDNQVLIQVYAVAIDGFDLAVLDVKGRADVGKWVPGRSFVGRCLQVGSYEKELVRGDLVMGLCDIRKVSSSLGVDYSTVADDQSGALAEYITCDRRRLARTPFPTQLTLEQMSLLPLQGLQSIRSLRGKLGRQYRALVCDPHRGITALMCQELSRSGTHVTALISGGDDHHNAQSLCMLHGAKGVLTGRPATVMNQLDDDSFDLVIDTQGGQVAYDAAKRVLKDGGR
jgi:NADPH:quinone reductase-like Zn-dependent oxidoreductase